ncbi:hypothetical protein [Cupriavidus sp. SW-Y-13]|uniref:hypothetical protein n=1 Tax=Cupriavidus sp. SW-Y-13 TaxID=2653854 RepID=UPI00136677FF|nr:hypothetical protein [Cupriavidus sp. SW-Y-13]MWL88597.1 hypothetical protein [Cupriavidus sp. SW-Y-13]
MIYQDQSQNVVDGDWGQVIDIEYENDEQGIDKATLRKISIGLNRIYGHNGESYYIPISVAHLSALESFSKRLFETDDLPYRVKRRNGIECYVALRMAYDIKLLPAYARIYSPSLAFPPDFDLFFEVYPQHEISQYGHIEWLPSDDEDRMGEIIHDVEPRYAEMAINFVLKIREAARKKQLAKRMRDWLSGCHRNRRYLRSFMIGILEEHARIMVVDVVFLYRRSACENQTEAIARGIKLRERSEREYLAYLDGTETDEVSDRVISLYELKEDLKTFFNNARHKPSLFGKDKFIDYFGRIEYSRDVGYHAHMCFFYKGSEAQRHIWYSHEIGKYFAKITEGRGYYFSANAKAAEGKYRNVGVGIVEHDDFEKIRHLWTAVSYFVKASQVVRVKNTGKEQMVLHGKRRERRGVKLGRPRETGLTDQEYRSRLERIFV